MKKYLLTSFLLLIVLAISSSALVTWDLSEGLPQDDAAKFVVNTYIGTTKAPARIQMVKVALGESPVFLGYKTTTDGSMIIIVPKGFSYEIAATKWDPQTNSVDSTKYHSVRHSNVNEHRYTYLYMTGK